MSRRDLVWGGLHSADCILRSVDFAEIEALQRDGRWSEAGEVLAREAEALVSAGAELLVICANTMHKVAAVAVDVPIVHIADATADADRAADLSTVGLLATSYTMEIARASRSLGTPDKREAAALAGKSHERDLSHFPASGGKR